MKELKMGSVVMLKRGFLGEPRGVRAVVYDTYTLGGKSGVSIITENGEDLGGFSRDEWEFLYLIEHTDFRYDFQNVMRLSQDFDKGVFNKIFNKYRR